MILIYTIKIFTLDYKVYEMLNFALGSADLYCLFIH
jgi:hypothetical protein